MYQVAFGQLGLGEYFWEMETREFLNAWIGYLDEKRQDYAVLFETVKMGSFYNTFSQDQQKALKRIRNPYIDTKPRGGIDPEGIGNMLSALAKGFNKDGK